MKALYITEKPSVAQEFAKALKLNCKRKDGYLESDDAYVTWCVGHLVTMCYPDAYDPALKRWSMETLPFLPEEYKYEVIPAVKKQFGIVKDLLTRKDVTCIYVCTDSGREGEYIYRLVDQMAGVGNKEKRRVWIDSQTEEEIIRGVREAKDLSAYDNLGASAYMRAIEDYLMGINFSRLLTLKYGFTISNYLKESKNTVIAVGRVMTCVLGMIVRREREIRNFVKQPFYKVIANVAALEEPIEAEWKAVEGSSYYQSPLLYKDIGFLKEEDAQKMVDYLSHPEPVTGILTQIQRKKEKKNPPLLYNLAELQNECSRLFKISPDETLKVVQELYEKKMVTYPRTDARVLSTAVAKEIDKNLKGLLNYPLLSAFANEALNMGSYNNLAKTQYVNDKQITDHYAIIPTGQGLGALKSLSALSANVYEVIVRRFLSIFYPAAEYQKTSITVQIKEESFFATFKTLIFEGYLKVANHNFGRKKTESGNDEEKNSSLSVQEQMKSWKKGMEMPVSGFQIKKGETTPPKRYNSGSLILAMENAGQFIEDEDLRAQIKGSGIGTSATRAEIIKKLVNNKYIHLQKKTQILTPTLLGEMIFDVVSASIKSLLNPELTASWEKGLTYVAEGTITKEEYMRKLHHFVGVRTEGVKQLSNQYMLRQCFDEAAKYYK
ncbi:MAG: type IA DNA topoisomerase [Lachnospiraceae bacterium]|nr:type IA DNA topoisomerase [Lachnospiraceae bacterium]